MTNTKAAGIRIVEVGESEGVSELVREHANLDHRIVATKRRLHNVVLYHDLAAAGSIIVRLPGSREFGPGLYIPSMRPDVAGHAFASDLRVNEGSDINITIIVA